MKKYSFIVFIAVVLGIIILFIAAYLWIFPYLHDRTLKEFSKPLISTGVPPKTELIDSLAEIGQQSGNSDHCDYLAAVLLKTDLSKAEVENYYRENYKGKSSVVFYWVNEYHKPGIGVVNPTNISTLDEWVNYKSKITYANLIVYIFEGSMTSALDSRCS